MWWEYEIDSVTINGEEENFQDLLNAFEEAEETVPVMKMQRTITIFFDGPVQKRHFDELEEAGYKRAVEMMEEGYTSGELNEYIKMDGADGPDGVQYTGWFEIDSKDVSDIDLLFNTDQRQSDGVTGAILKSQ